MARNGPRYDNRIIHQMCVFIHQMCIEYPNVYQSCLYHVQIVLSSFGCWWSCVALWLVEQNCIFWIAARHRYGPDTAHRTIESPYTSRKSSLERIITGGLKHMWDPWYIYICHIFMIVVCMGELFIRKRYLYGKVVLLLDTYVCRPWRWHYYSRGAKSDGTHT